MDQESKNIFKVFRVLYFPMSINAVGLGAIAALIFHVVTWLFLEFFGPENVAAHIAARDFLEGVLDLVTRVDWPYTDPARAWLFGVQLVVFFFLWATFGVAICRILALRIARDEYCTLADAWSYAWRVRLTGLLYPIAILLPIAVLAACNFGAGLLGSIPYLGWFFGVFLIPLVIISTLVMILTGVAGLFSIGFVPAAIAIERKGTYDSLGKAFNYIFARPLPLILYVVLLWAFLYFIHLLLVSHGLVERVMQLTLQPFFTTTYEEIAVGAVDELEGFAWFCGKLHEIVLLTFQLLVWGALISYALGAFTSMFLIFRRDVDGPDYAEIAEDPAQIPQAPAAPVSEPAPAPAEPAAAAAEADAKDAASPAADSTPETAGEKSDESPASEEKPPENPPAS